MVSSHVFRFRYGVSHLGIPLLVLALSVAIIFGVLKLNEKSVALDFPVGQIHADQTVHYGWGTDIQDTKIFFTATDVQGANGALVDRVRYYLVNPTLATGHEWGDPDWCSIPENYQPNTGTTCNPSGLITYFIGDSSKPYN